MQVSQDDVKKVQDFEKFVGKQMASLRVIAQIHLI